MSVLILLIMQLLWAADVLEQGHELRRHWPTAMACAIIATFVLSADLALAAVTIYFILHSHLTP